MVRRAVERRQFGGGFAVECAEEGEADVEQRIERALRHGEVAEAVEIGDRRVGGDGERAAEIAVCAPALRGAEARVRDHAQRECCIEGHVASVAV